MRKCFFVVAILALAIVATACEPPGTPTMIVEPPRPTRTPTVVPANDEEAIRQIINAEGQATALQDIDRLQGIWASDGVVTDASGTSDKVWKGWQSVRDRYVNIVFPSNPPFAEHPNIQVTITNDTATAISDTKIGITNAKNNDRWTLRKMNGQWKIASLTFGVAGK